MGTGRMVVCSGFITTGCPPATSPTQLTLRGVAGGVVCWLLVSPLALSAGEGRGEGVACGTLVSVAVLRPSEGEDGVVVRWLLHW